MELQQRSSSHTPPSSPLQRYQRYQRHLWEVVLRWIRSLHSMLFRPSVCLCGNEAVLGAAPTFERSQAQRLSEKHPAIHYVVEPKSWCNTIQVDSGAFRTDCQSQSAPASCPPISTSEGVTPRSVEQIREVSSCNEPACQFEEPLPLTLAALLKLSRPDEGSR